MGVAAHFPGNVPAEGYRALILKALQEQTSFDGLIFIWTVLLVRATRKAN